MARHEIPTHLDVEDKILGPLTTRDALYLLVGASAAYGIGTQTTLASWLRTALAGAVSVIALLFALVKIRGRPLEAWLFSGLAYTILPKRTVWTPRAARSARVHQSPGVRRRPYQLRMRWRVRATTPQRRSAIR
jgi:hypothetical protein